MHSVARQKLINIAMKIQPITNATCAHTALSCGYKNDTTTIQTGYDFADTLYNTLERPRDASCHWVTQDHLKWHCLWRVCKSLLEFHWIFSALKWRDLETGGRGLSRLLKMAPFNRYEFLLVRHCKYSSILYCFWVIWCWIIVTLKSGL